MTKFVLPLHFAEHETHSTESSIAIICDFNPHLGERFQWMCDALDPIGQRNAEIMRAAELFKQGSISATAKKIERELEVYLTRGTWIKGDLTLEFAPPDFSEMRKSLWRISKLNGGETLGWRQILTIIEIK